jgi:16S rRNA (guanine527-N7)-methyltransferase
MKSAYCSEEIETAQTAINILGGKIGQNIVFDLVENMPRRIILIKKISQTPTAYPRNAKKIANSPIK